LFVKNSILEETPRCPGTTPYTVTWIMAWLLMKNTLVIEMEQWLAMELDTTVKSKIFHLYGPTKSKIFHTYEPTRVKWVGT